MAVVFIILILLIAALAIWAAIVALSGRTRAWVRVFYLCSFVAAAVASYFTTFHYIYYANPNSRFHGWPVPTVIFQRDSPTSPWLDFIGPTLILAYPINFLLFILLPSIAVLVLVHRLRSTGLFVHFPQNSGFPK